MEQIYIQLDLKNGMKYCLNKVIIMNGKNVFKLQLIFIEVF